jgi:hypothetical protein
LVGTVGVVLGVTVPEFTEYELVPTLFTAATRKI